MIVNAMIEFDSQGMADQWQPGLMGLAVFEEVKNTRWFMSL